MLDRNSSLSASQIAQRLGIIPITTRDHLDKMWAEGLIDRMRGNGFGSGMGTPYLWFLVRKDNGEIE